ncbi:MAG TPA: tripartite tricarboxylate transporter substrate binding protein [Thermodesulfobacteriota bacterium]|nr:tripartite tricarboxylate transporter substrate binding protein [Thermodesulfobacteriota bacterium]
MRTDKKVLGMLVLCFCLVLPTWVGAAEKFPTKPIELVVPFAAGGSTDVLARLVAKFAPKYFDKPLVVVNKPGGGGVTGTEGVVRSKPDGYSLFLGYGSGHDLVMPHFQKLPYKTFEDLLPVCRLSVHSVAMINRADAPYKNLKEFIEWGKKKDQVTASVSTKAGSVDITFQALGKAAGLKIVTVPFRGGADAVTAIVGGQTDTGGNHPSEVISHIKAKRLIPIAVALEQRDPAIPDVPTFKELGYNVVTVGSVKGVAAPKGTPPEVISYLSDRFKKVCEDPEFIKAMKDIGQPVMYQGPAEFGRYLKDGFEQYGNLIKEFNIKLE